IGSHLLQKRQISSEGSVRAVAPSRGRLPLRAPAKRKTVTAKGVPPLPSSKTALCSGAESIGAGSAETGIGGLFGLVL
ncbi:MAG TPA: hypothetical protein VGL17_02160, partial [Gemmatimonadaceae bacterium]